MSGNIWGFVPAPLLAFPLAQTDRICPGLVLWFDRTSHDAIFHHDRMSIQLHQPFAGSTDLGGKLGSRQWLGPMALWAILVITKANLTNTRCEKKHELEYKSAR